MVGHKAARLAQGGPGARSQPEVFQEVLQEVDRLPHPQCPRKFWCVHLHDEDWLDERLARQGAYQGGMRQVGMSLVSDTRHGV